MKKLLILSALFIFACSVDNNDSSNANILLFLGEK